MIHATYKQLSLQDKYAKIIPNLIFNNIGYHFHLIVTKTVSEFDPIFIKNEIGTVRHNIFLRHPRFEIPSGPTGLAKVDQNDLKY